MTAPALEAAGLVKTYGRRRALDGLNLEIPAGCIFGLVGANGAGKTTLMSVCVGLLRPNAGRLSLLGDGPFHPARHAGRVSLLPQDSRLPLHARVAELLRCYGRLQGVPADEIDPQVERLLAWVNLADRAHAPIRTLSHGMVRRVTIAQAFLGDPELVLLDEPLSGLDPREVVRIRDLLLQRRGRQTIVISSHALDEIERLCDQVAFIDHGRRIKQDTLRALTRRHTDITYRLAPAPAPLPLERLQQALPAATWQPSPDGRALTVSAAGDIDLATVNATVLPILLAAGVGVEEIRRGSGLEHAYLTATTPTT